MPGSLVTPRPRIELRRPVTGGGGSLSDPLADPLGDDMVTGPPRVAREETAEAPPPETGPEVVERPGDGGGPPPPGPPPEGPGDAGGPGALAEPSVGSDTASDAAAAGLPAAEANAAAGFGPEAVALLRRTVGLPRRGTLDEAFAEALRAAQAAVNVPATGVLDTATLRALPYDGGVVRRAMGWYRREPAGWSAIPTEQRTSALATVCRALGVAADSATWRTTRVPGLEASEAFVRGAIAWQLDRRLGLTPDGQLGPSSLAAMGIDTGGRPALDVDDGGGAGRLGALTSGTDMGSRLLAAESDLGPLRVGALRGDDDPQVGLGALAGGISPSELVRMVAADHADVVLRSFFPGGSAGHSVDEVLAGLGGATSMATLAGSPWMAGLARLMRTPEAAQAQARRYAEHALGPAEAAVAGADTAPTAGTMALATLGVTPPAGGDVQATQLAMLRQALGPEIAGLDSNVRDIVTRYVEGRLAAVQAGTPPAATSFAQAATQAEEREGASLPFARNARGAITTPPGIRRFEALLAHFGDVWSQPYTGSHGDLRAPPPAETGGSTAGTGSTDSAPPGSTDTASGGGSGHIRPASAGDGAIVTDGPVAHDDVPNAISAVRRHQPPFNFTWIAELQRQLHVPDDGRYTPATVQAVARFQQEHNIRARPLGGLDDRTVRELRSAFPALAALETEAPEPTLDTSGNAWTRAAAELDRPTHETAYAEFQAGSHAVRGLPPTWDEFMGQMASLSFLGQSVTGHPLFLQRMSLAANWLRGRFPGSSDAEIVRRLGIRVGTTQRTQLRAETTTSFHVFGMAIDIDPSDNPWVGGNETASADRNQAAQAASWRAGWLMGGHTGFSVRGTWNMAGTEGDGTSTTDEIYAAMSTADSDLEAYFALRTDLPALQARVRALGAAPAVPAGVTIPDEVRARLSSAGAEAWQTQINEDWTATHGRATGGLTQDRGDIMDMHQETVRAMRDVAGLAWGACDMEGSSGDFMHFDARTIPGVEAMKNHIRRALQAAGGGGGGGG